MDVASAGALAVDDTHSRLGVHLPATDEDLGRIIERAARLQAQHTGLHEDALDDIGAQLGIDPSHLSRARDEVAAENARRRQRRTLGWVFGSLAAVAVLGVGATFAVGWLVVGAVQPAPRSVSVRTSSAPLDAAFERQIALVEEAAPYLSDSNWTALQDDIAAFHAADTQARRVQLMKRVNSGLKSAVFFKRRIGDAKADSILSENRDLKTQFFFASAPVNGFDLLVQ